MSDDVIVDESTAGTWPWHAAEAAGSAWVLVSDDHVEYCLNVLPPIYFPGGFAVSEPIRDDEQFREVYLCIAVWRGRHYAREMAREDAANETRLLRAYLDASNVLAEEVGR